MNNCDFTANYPLYVYNSGGKIVVDGGTYTGNVAAIQIDNTTSSAKSESEIKGGTFNGAIKVGDKSDLTVTGGSFTDASVKGYCADGFTIPDAPDANGMYTVAPDGTTGVEGIETDEVVNDGVIYDLNGVRRNEKFENLTPGIYIIGGKKVLK